MKVLALTNFNEHFRLLVASIRLSHVGCLSLLLMLSLLVCLVVVL